MNVGGPPNSALNVVAASGLRAIALLGGTRLLMATLKSQEQPRQM
jgi:hypothetical protein